MATLLPMPLCGARHRRSQQALGRWARWRPPHILGRGADVSQRQRAAIGRRPSGRHLFHSPREGKAEMYNTIIPRIVVTRRRSPSKTTTLAEYHVRLEEGGATASRLAGVVAADNGGC